MTDIVTMTHSHRIAKANPQNGVCRVTGDPDSQRSDMRPADEKTTTLTNWRKSDDKKE